MGRNMEYQMSSSLNSIKGCYIGDYIGALLPGFLRGELGV